MRLFEEEISPTIATDGPCEVLRVEERMEVSVQRGWGQPVLSRRFGVVIYRAKTRMYPVMGKDGQWALPPSATETRLILVKPSLHGTELPASTGRYLGSFRNGDEHWHAFLAKPVQESRRPEGSEAPKAAGAPSPSKADGPSRAPAATDQRGHQQSGAQPSSPRNSGQPGRQ